MNTVAKMQVGLEGINAEISDFISRGVDFRDDERFNSLATGLFAYQYETNSPYRTFCQQRGVKPRMVTTWEDLPAIHSSAFKNDIVTSFPVASTELSLMTSGSTDPNVLGQIYRDKSSTDLTFYANRLVTKEFLFPDVDKIKLLLMVPSPKVAPGMGMAVGLEQVRHYFGTEDSEYFISPDGMDFAGLVRNLRKAEETGEPVAMVGATSGFVFFLNYCREQGLKFKLPAKSRICDGGGYRGTFGTFTKQEIYQQCTEYFGLAESCYVNTLGSGECSTNYFDNVYRDTLLGKTVSKRHKVPLPWTRVMAVHPTTGERLPLGELGLLRHIDLVNSAMVVAIQSDNLGYETEDGFEVVGRADLAKVAKHFNSMESLIAVTGSPAYPAADSICSTVADRMLGGDPTCSTVADRMLGGDPTCSTVADRMLSGDPTCSTVADRMLGGDPTCSTVADRMLSGDPTCSTVADRMLGGDPTCSTVADRMLGGDPTCSTVADRMLEDAHPDRTEYAERVKNDGLHQKIFKSMTGKELKLARESCPFFKMMKMFRKAEVN